MKVGVISDIHSNIIALKLALQEFERQKVEKIICCGDIIGIGPWPEETVQLLIQYKDRIIGVRGNHEQYFFKGIPKIIHKNEKMSDDQIKNHQWMHKNLSKSSIDFLESLPLERDIEIEGKKIHIAHYPADETGKFKKYINKANLEQIKEQFSYADADIFFYGHTHVETINEENNIWYINPGSVGCPKSTNYVACGILEIKEKNINYEALHIEYNKEDVIKKIEEEKYPFFRKILMLFYGVNENLVYLLGEKAIVENIKTGEVSCGEIDLNNEKIKAYIIGECNSDSFNGIIISMITLETDEKRFIVADKHANLDYTKIVNFFSQMEELKNARFRTLYEKSTGAITYKIEDGKIYYLVIYSKNGFAGFPKGHIEYGETEEETAKREIQEEIGVNVEIKNDFKETINYMIDDTPAHKEVILFLAQVPNDAKIVIDEEELTKYEYLGFEDAKKVLKENLHNALEIADKIIKEEIK